MTLSTTRAAVLEDLYGMLSSRYEVMRRIVPLGDGAMSLLGVRDTHRLLESISVEAFAVDERLPYWADLWVSSIRTRRRSSPLGRPPWS